MIWKTFDQEFPEYDRLILHRSPYKIIYLDKTSIGETACVGKFTSSSARGHKILNNGSVNVKDDGTVSLYKSGVTESTLKDKEDLENCYWTYLDDEIVDIDKEISNVDEWLRLEKERLEEEHKEKVKNLENFGWVTLEGDFYHSIDEDILNAKKAYDEKYNKVENRGKYY